MQTLDTKLNCAIFLVQSTGISLTKQKMTCLNDNKFIRNNIKIDYGMSELVQIFETLYKWNYTIKLQNSSAYDIIKQFL